MRYTEPRGDPASGFRIFNKETAMPAVASDQESPRKRVRITNKTNPGRDIVLPPVAGKRHPNADGSPGRDWPALRIPPGGYNVDTEYLELIRGPKATRGARKAFEQLTTDHGNGPDLVLSEDPRAVRAKEGIEPPKSLKAYGEDKAVIIVQHTDEADALRLWLKNENRDGVRDAIEKRLAEVR